MEDQFTEEDQVSQQIIQNLIQIVQNNKQIIADLEKDLVLYDVKLDELANIPIIQEKFFQQTQSNENNSKDQVEQPQKQQLQTNKQLRKLKPIQTKKIQKQVPTIKNMQHNEKPSLSSNQRNKRQSDNDQLLKVQKKIQKLEFNDQEILQQQLIEEIMEQQKNEKQKIQEYDINVQGEKMEQKLPNQNLQEQLKLYNLHQKERQDKIANKIKSNETLQNTGNARQTINCRKCNHEFHNLKALKRHFCD